MGSGTVALGVIGNITAMIMFFSPLPTFLMIHKQKDTGRFSAFPYVCTLMNCLLWFFYGLPMISENNILVLTINGAGIVIETVYLIVFIYYATWPVKTQVLRSVVFVIFFCAITFAITLGAFQGDDRTTFLGSINVIINTMMYAAPLSVMRMVIETKSVEYMPFMLSLCSFVNATLWALYGILKEDKFIIIPNGLGVLLGALQLGLYAKYRKYKAPPATLTESIAAAYTTEGATATDLSDIITRGATDLSEAISKGATSAGSARFSQPTSTTGTFMTPPTSPPLARAHRLHAESLKVELMEGPRKDEMKPGQRLSKAASAPDRPTTHTPPADFRKFPAPAPSPVSSPAPAAPPQDHQAVPAQAPVPAAAAAAAALKASETLVKDQASAATVALKDAAQEIPAAATKAAEATKEAAKSFKDAAVKGLPAKVKETAALPIKDQAPKVLPAKRAQEGAPIPAAAEADLDKEAFARMKAQEEQKRADELRRLQEAFDEEEYGAELETIFL